MCDDMVFDEELKRIVDDGVDIEVGDDGNVELKASPGFYKAWFDRRIAIAMSKRGENDKG